MRVAKGWKQKDLALKADVKESLLKRYERGEGVPERAIVMRLEKALGQPLPKLFKKKRKA